MNAPRPKFPLGRVVATPGAIEAMDQAGTAPLSLLTRHQSGDWGDVCDEDRGYNDADIQAGGRLLSAYRLSTGVKVWIITEADRSATTLLLPDEY